MNFSREHHNRNEKSRESFAETMQILANETGESVDYILAVYESIEMHDCEDYGTVNGKFQKTGKRSPHWKHATIWNLDADEVDVASAVLGYYHGSHPGDGQWLTQNPDGTYNIEGTYQCEGGPNEMCRAPWEWCGESVTMDRSNPDHLKAIRSQKRRGFGNLIQHTTNNRVTFSI